MGTDSGPPPVVARQLTGRPVRRATTKLPLPLGDVIVTTMLEATGAPTFSPALTTKVNRVSPSTIWLNDSPSGTVMEPPDTLPTLAVMPTVDPPTSGFNRSSCT